jgi:hypothetical protein
MNESERVVRDYLVSLRLGPVVFEPDGNQPPDFLVDGRIAVEARRLNANELVGVGHRGLEETSIPLYRAVSKALEASGPPISGCSWYVHCTYRRPLPSWREVEYRLQQAVVGLRANAGEPPTRMLLGTFGQFEFVRAGDAKDTLLVPGGFCDEDEGGFVVADVARNLQYCVAEKTNKVERVRHKYRAWWLVFEDRIAYGFLNSEDVLAVRSQVEGIDGFGRVVLVSPLNPVRAVEVWTGPAAPGIAV